MSESPSREHELKELLGAFHGIPAESAAHRTMWTVSMCCVWAATRDAELLEHVALNDPESPRWLKCRALPFYEYGEHVLARRSHLLAAAGLEQLVTLGAALTLLQDFAARGAVKVCGMPHNQSQAEVIPADAWANLRIATTPAIEGFVALPIEQQNLASWWSCLGLRPDEVRKVWPDVPEGVAPLAEIGSPRRSGPKQQMPSRAAIALWYEERVRNWPALQAHPSRDDDVEAAQKHFECSGLRSMVRDIRRKSAPPEWTSGGPKGDKRPIRSRAK